MKVREARKIAWKGGGGCSKPLGHRAVKNSQKTKTTELMEMQREEEEGRNARDHQE